MKASDLSKQAIDILTTLKDEEWANTRQLADLLSTDPRGVRNNLKRIKLFGLVNYSLDESTKPATHLWQISKEGLRLIGLSKKPLLTETETVDLLKQQPSIVSFLRNLAEQMNRMADTLSAYDE